MTRLVRILAAAFALIITCSYISSLADGVAPYDQSNPQILTADHLYAKSALLVDERTGEELLSKNARVRMFPASTTKIMTLLLALESDIPLDAQVTIPAQAADIPEGSSVIPVKPGDVTSFEDLLYGFMLSSGNDGANAIAILTDGSIEAFVARMNARAQQLGCEGTHYVNAHGYHDAQHYTTAKDLAVIACEAMKNPVFRKIVAAPTWTMHIMRAGAEVEQQIISRNSLLQSGEKYYYPDCTGIKTGHHHKAGWCFVGSAQRDGKRVVCVVLDCERENDKWYDAAKLFEYGFTCYAPVTLGELLLEARDEYAAATVDDADPADPQGGNLQMDVTVTQGGDQILQLVAGSRAARSEALERVSNGLSVQWDRELTAPVTKGEHMGKVEVQLEDGTRAVAELTASRDVAVKPAPTPAPTPTPVPAETATATPQAAPDEGEGKGTQKSGALPIAIVALLLLLGAACALLALKLKGGRRRRRARRRARRRR
ncbi:MAG: D-alanyl-D-alanine carboxypeptidase [Clostridia bacterium]|nr:D-alanyl-D-alanine carboxypeptidase [Clostridia bacterium]